MHLLNVPQDTPPEIKRASMKNISYFGLLLLSSRREGRGFFLWKAMIPDWILYRYEFQRGRSAHDNGIIQLKISPDILDLV